MRVRSPHVLLCLLMLFLSACAPPSGDQTSVGAGLHPYQTATASPAAADAAGLILSAQTPLPSPTPSTYTVQSGDTLSQIAEKFHVSLDALQAANPKVNPNGMSIGEKLQIPSVPANGSGEPTPTPAPLPVRQIACYPTADGGLWCFILVQDDSPGLIENVSAQVTLLDSNGQPVDSRPAYLPLNVIRAGQSLPLAVFFPPEIAMNVHPQVQVLTAMRIEASDPRYLPATIQNTLVEVDGSGLSGQVSGHVTLPPDSKPARSIWIAAAVYDGAGSVVGVQRWESDQGLAAGQTLPFSFMVASVAGKIERVDFAVEARP